MQKTGSAGSYQSHPNTDKVLTIPSTIYNALPSVDQLMVQALEEIGKVRVIEEDER